jgi:radical SAM superfamily enzyme YgiQ (UPF0313 family)
MKVLLVQPRIGYMDALRSAPGLPLGLLSVASAVPDHLEVELIDARLEPDLEGRLVRSLRQDPLLVGITCHTGPMIRSALEISRLVKRHSEAPVIWGGVHPSLAPQVTLSEPSIDVCVRGEGEATLGELIQTLEDGASPDTVAGLAFRRDGRVILTPNRPLLPAEQWPEPRWELVDVARYLPLYDGRPSLFYQASRGCPNRCSYCYNSPFNHQRFRHQPAAEVVASVTRLHRRHGFEDVYFVDDNFFVRLDWAAEVIRGIHGLGLTWQVQGVDIASLLRMDSAYIRHLGASGCSRLTIGVETGNDRMRRRMGKQGSRQDVIEAIGRLRGTGIRVFASFMVGFPQELRTEMQETVALALELLDRYDFVRCSPVYCFTPYPGTASYELAVEAGFRPPANLSAWSRIGSFDDFTWLEQAGNQELDRDTFLGLNAVTLLIDGKVRDYSTSRLLALLAALYRPVARFRARHLFFHAMPERWLLRWLLNRQAPTHEPLTRPVAPTR